MMKTRLGLVLVAVLALSLLTAAIAMAQSSTTGAANFGRFSLDGAPQALGSVIGYQGQLLFSGEPVNGSCDFQFSLWSAQSGPAQIGGLQSRNDVPVANGMFMVDDLDFGASAFSGDPRWLQIAVQCNADPAFTTLSPRSPIRPAPYALYSGNSDKLDGQDASAFLSASGGSLSGNLAITTGSFYNDFEIGVEGAGTWPGPYYSWFVIKDLTDPVQPLRFLVKGDTGDVAIVKNLGVGTDAPEQKLHVMGISKFEPGSGELSISTPGSWPGFIVIAPNGHRRDIRFRNEGIQLLTNDDGTLPTNENGINIDESGNVGIGTMYPAAKLDVRGTARTQVLQITGGADLAEPFEIAGAQNVRPGMVVAIDPQHEGQLRIAGQAYDPMVAGCVSGANGIQPGLVMQQEGTLASGAFPVSLTGRVYCLADASYGAIQPGDLLTSSDTPGHAMLASDYARAQGAIIGKAMSALASGRGLILVLVTLQ
ncbi:MAG: hypothetical protein JXA78_18515 [Anaerolineales bacterium]|nr:hypothetical protein [Anaerolineales bacterium]